MLNALAVSLLGANQEGIARAAKSFARQGFDARSRLDWHGGTLGTWTHPTQADVDDCEVRTPEGKACCVGPLWYHGRFGRAALRSLLEDLHTTGRIDEQALRGNFVLFVRTERDCLLMNDALGLARIYASADNLFYSTSWLASCAYVGRLDLDEAAAVEYVLLGASHSDRTVAHGITTLPRAHAFDLSCGRLRTRLLANIADKPWRPATFEEAAGKISAHLKTVCREVATAFPGRTRAALSGGFDSRLILAGLLASGNLPELYVYGNAASTDIPVARAVAHAVGTPIEVVDKGILDRSRLLPDLQRIVESALFFDGLPNDGIHDLGADQQTRLEQTAGGFIALNGGGGEIFRNYFHLPDRPLRAKDIVRTFYRGFDHRVFQRHDGLSTYEARLAASITCAIGLGRRSAHQKLKRTQVELVYPFLRCHHWMGVNNSVSLRHGYYVTPLVDLATVRMACWLPLSWKNAGRLESRLIAQLHPVVAGQMSLYGFRFSEGPDWHARFAGRVNRMRPVFARPYINATRRRLQRLGVLPGVMQHYRSLLPGEWQLDRVLVLQRLPDTQAFARALAIEVVFRELL